MTASLTIRDLFLPHDHGDHHGDQQRDAARVRLPPVPTGLTHIVTDGEWHRLAARVGDLLEIGVVDVLVNGWKRQAEVRAQLRVTALDPTRTAMVGIGHHTLDSTHHPSIELRCRGNRLAELSFPVALTFQIAGVALTLRNGAIREIHTGEMKVRGTVKFESTVILERDLSSSPLPGRIVLHPAWPLILKTRKSRLDSPGTPSHLPPAAART